MVQKDYKKSRRSSGGLDGYTGFGLGLVVGLGIGLAIHWLDRPEAPADAAEAKPAPASARAAEAPAPEETESYDFYNVLPKFEVVVPENEKDVRRDLPAQPVEKQGSYVLQVGSYRDFNEADRIRAQLALAGIESKVQRVSVDNDTWHRVRVGPLTDLGEVNRIRGKLREADLDVLVIRVGD